MILATWLAAPASHADVKSPPDPDPALPVYVGKALPDAALEQATYAIPDTYYGLTPAGHDEASLARLLAALGLPPKDSKDPKPATKPSANAPKLFETDLPTYVPEANPSFRTGDPREPAYFRLTPAVGYTFASDSDFRVTCALRFERVEKDKVTWTARYVSSWDAPFSTKDPEVAGKLHQDLQDCFQSVETMFALHRAKGGNLDALLKPALLTKDGKTVQRLVMYHYFPAKVSYVDEDGMVDEDPARFQDLKLK
jgi:hypothetical protein